MKFSVRIRLRIETRTLIRSGLYLFLNPGKAPPNLPPGVPPLLPNPYIMAPGLLHAYPVSLRPPAFWQVWLCAANLCCHVTCSPRCTATTTSRCCRPESRWSVPRRLRSIQRFILISFTCLLLQDYYSIPFPTPTTALTGRDGSLTSNHYSGL